jgi:acyl carrier protein
MKPQAIPELTDRLIEQIRRKANGKISDNTEIELGTDLLTAGILDSIGFVELLMFIETEYGYQIDLVNADPAQFTTINGLCELALKSAN